MTFCRRSSIGLVLWMALLAIAPAQDHSPAETPSQQVLLERMAEARAANRASFRPYVVTRNYTLFQDETKPPRSEVSVEVSFVPPDSKQYQIVHRTGSGLGERLVRRMLDGETTIVKENGLTDLTTANYDFHLAGEETIEGRRCFVLKMDPKRKDKTLVRGTVWVDALTYLLHRMEGEPAASPSWWLRDTHITFIYGDVEGMWLQTSSEITTHVRIFGRHQMVAQDVKYQTGARPKVAGLPAARVRAALQAAAARLGSS